MNMSADPIASEVLELLRESREYARYLGELGVETIPPAADLELSAVTPSASPIDATTKLKQEIPSLARPALETPINPPTRSPPVLPGPTSHPASLFENPL